MDGADVCGTSSRACRRPPDVISAVAILDLRWRRRKWRHPGPGAVFSTPIAAEAQDGGPSASGRHLGWPHLRNRKWSHPRWRPEAEGPPSCAAAAMGVEKTALYYWRQTIIWTNAWVLLTEPLRIQFNEILIDVHTLSFRKMHSINGGHFVSASMC